MYLSHCPGLGVTTDLDSIASSSVICYHSLNNYHSPKVVQALQGAQTQAMPHASWHCDLLEFYILYASFYNQIPWRYWCDDGQQGPQALDVWAWWWRVGYCWRSCLGTMGNSYLYFIELIPNISQSNSRMQPSSFHKTPQGSLLSFPQWISLPAISTQKQGNNSQLLSLKPWSLHTRKWTTTTPSLMTLLHTALLWFYTLAWNSNIFATKIGKVNGLMWQRALFMINTWSMRSLPMIWTKTWPKWKTQMMKDMHHLIISLLLPNSAEMRSRPTWAFLSKMSKICWSGGMITISYIQAFITWLWIISVSLPPQQPLNGPFYKAITFSNSLTIISHQVQFELFSALVPGPIAVSLCLMMCWLQCHHQKRTIYLISYTMYFFYFTSYLIHMWNLQFFLTYCSYYRTHTNNGEPKHCMEKSYPLAVRV